MASSTSLLGILSSVGPLLAERTNRTADGGFPDARTRVVRGPVGGFPATGGILHTVEMLR